MAEIFISEHPQWLSNTYLVADAQAGSGFFVDAGGPVDPLVLKAKELGIDVSHVLLTHHHIDHVAELSKLRDAFPDAEVMIDRAERAGVPEATSECMRNETGKIGDFRVKAIPTPGHTSGMLALLVNEELLFTGDTLFKGSVGGLHASGHTTYADLKSSVLRLLTELPPETTIYPGHTEPTTVAAEWDSNPFVRIWRGLDPEGSDRCMALGRPATLILMARDYDGGKKAWVRWENGEEDIVPGSRVELQQ
jgi:glyoxylase-like metal-dependent hydrolase (beta-lactamase superfamily II)